MNLMLFLVCSGLSLVPIHLGSLSAVRQDSQVPTSRIVVLVEATIPGVDSLNLVKPVVPANSDVSGRVVVQVKVRRNGTAFPLKSQFGSLMLRNLSTQAVKNSQFVFKKGNQRQTVAGTISYTFALTEITQDDLRKMVGRIVAFAGVFSGPDKIGPYIQSKDERVLIYLVRTKVESEYTWTLDFDRLQGKTMVFWGKLLFSPAIVPGPQVRLPASGLPAYYYFPQQTTKVLPLQP